MKWLLIAVGVLAGIVVLVFAVGAMLPLSHTATVRVRLRRPAADVYGVLVDVAGAPAWRRDLRQVEVISAPGEPLRWREMGKYGVMTFVRDEERQDERLVGRIADRSQGFGGRWIFELAPAGEGSVLTVTEEGEVYSPIFRFMSRFVFGHYATLEAYVTDLAGHFGEEVQIERVST